jgi:hypothetical protein
MSMEDFMEMEGMLMEENEDDMGKIGLLEVDDRFFFVFCRYDEEVVVSSCWLMDGRSSSFPIFLLHCPLT